MEELTRPCLAVLGTGSIGMRHLSVLKQLAGVRVLAIPVRSEKIAQLQGMGYEAVVSLAEAVKRGANLCIVATDTGRHVADGIEAIQMGLDLLVEKPLSTDAWQAGRLYAEALAEGRKLYVACLMRFPCSMGLFRQQLSEIGILHAVRIECQSYLPDWRPGRPYRDSYSARADEGGVLRDLIHEIDYAGWLFGWPSALQARVANLRRLGIEADEAAELWWEGQDGVHVSIRLDYLSRPTRRVMTAFGSQGTLEWDGVRNMVTLRTASAPPREVVMPQTKDEILRDQVRAFLDVGRGSASSVLATGLDGVRALAVCDAARLASVQRREEKVVYP